MGKRTGGEKSTFFSCEKRRDPEKIRKKHRMVNILQPPRRIITEILRGQNYKFICFLLKNDGLIFFISVCNINFVMLMYIEWQIVNS